MNPNHPLRRGAIVLLTAAMAAAAGCKVDAGDIHTERIDYGEVLVRSWKDQLLLNTVRIRHMDPPMLLDVASIIHQHAVTGEAAASATFDPGKWSGLTGTVTGSSHFENRPTFTYAPVHGEQFTRTMLTPVHPNVIAFLLESGWPVDILFRVYVKRVNGLRNRRGTGRYLRPADPEFDELIRLLQQFQIADQLHMQLVRQGDKVGTESLVLALPGQDSEPARRVRKLLGIAPDARQISIGYGSVQQGDQDIALLTRSMVEVMLEFGAAVDVPETDVAEGRTLPVLLGDAAAGPSIRIHSSVAEPTDTYASALYHGRWYWIDDKDFASKTIFTTALLILSLTETGGTSVAPVVTISTN
jgi:hypothetical protein